MTLVLGIDPGLKGALAVYDSETRQVVGNIMDMPTWNQVVGKSKRPRLDMIGLDNMMEMFKLMGVSLIVMELVGGRPKQSASAGFQFGHVVGVIETMLFYTGIPVELVTPQVWKKELEVPGKSKADDTAIMARAEQILPDARAQFRTPRGRKLMDRAEAAMIAKFGGDHIINRAEPKEGK